MGDLFFMGMFPFVDLNAGGDVEGLIGSVEKVIAELKDGVKIVPGHGPLSSVEDLKTYHRMLVETTAVVRKAMAAGKSLAEIQAQGVPDEWKSWGTGFIKTDRWIETIYKSLNKKRS
jgi:glyoxylase-like metal-dependent hydrolase (beta-lactamase superfamily II)